MLYVLLLNTVYIHTCHVLFMRTAQMGTEVYMSRRKQIQVHKVLSVRVSQNHAAVINLLP